MAPIADAMKLKPLNADQERSLAQTIARYVRSQAVTRAQREWIGSLLLDYGDSPQLFRFIAEELEKKPPLEGWGNHKRRISARGALIIEAALRAYNSGAYTIAGIREQWKEVSNEPCPPDFAIRDLLARIGAPLFSSKRGPKGGRTPGSKDALGKGWRKATRDWRPPPNLAN
jgi:hypothetical protein